MQSANPRPRDGFTLIELLVVIAIIGVLIGLLLAAVQRVREAANQTACRNNLKQIGLAMHNYHSVNNAFPMPAIVDKDGKPLLSWRVAILPFIERGELYNKFHTDEPWGASRSNTFGQRSRPGSGR